MGHVHAVTHHKLIGTGKADKIRLDLHGALAGFFQQAAGLHPRAAGGQQIGGKSNRAARFQNIVDQQDIDEIVDSHLVGGVPVERLRLE